MPASGRSLREGHAGTRAARASPRDVSRVPRLRSAFLPPRPPRLPPTTRSLFGGRKLPLAAVMPLAYSLPTDLSPATVVNASSLLRIVALALISGAAIASRLFAVVNFESVIHELYVSFIGSERKDSLLTVSFTAIRGSISASHVPVVLELGIDTRM